MAPSPALVARNLSFIDENVQAPGPTTTDSWHFMGSNHENDDLMGFNQETW
jgi:hypothetical protein